MTEQKNHHVAWKDRLGLNQQWMRDIQACSESHGTPEYVAKVDRFRNDIINIKNGPSLYTIIDDYWKNDLTQLGKQLYDEWKNLYPQESKVDEEAREAQDRIRIFQAEKLYHFIVQTLEDNGFGFYQSTMVEDEMM